MRLNIDRRTLRYYVAYRYGMYLFRLGSLSREHTHQTPITFRLGASAISRPKRCAPSDAAP